MSLEGKTALVTGSTGGGIGRSIAITLARAGAAVVLNYGTNRTGPEVEAVAAGIAGAIGERGGHAIAVKADTRKAYEVEAMVSRAIMEFGSLDILVINAGGEYIPGDMAKIPPERFRSTIEAEIDGAFLAIRSALPHMRHRKWGRIVLLGMHEPLAPGADVPLDYALGKGARALMVKHLAEPERKHNVAINLVNPPPGHTERYATLDEAFAAAYEGFSQSGADKIEPQDIAEAVLYLCSEESGFVTGSDLNIALESHAR